MSESVPTSAAGWGILYAGRYCAKRLTEADCSSGVIWGAERGAREATTAGQHRASAAVRHMLPARWLRARPHQHAHPQQPCYTPNGCGGWVAVTNSVSSWCRNKMPERGLETPEPVSRFHSAGLATALQHHCKGSLLWIDSLFVSCCVD